MSELNNAEFNSEVRTFVAMPAGRAKELALKNIFVRLTESRTLGRWAYAMAAKSNYQNMDGLEDIQQVISEKLIKTLNARTPETTTRVSDWLKFLHGTAQHAVKDYLGSSDVTVASGMSGVARRRAIIAGTRRELVAEFNREPTRDEIIERANTWALASHKDASKQGILLSEPDFSPASIAAISLDETPTAAPGITNDADMYNEALLALRRLRTMAAEMFPGDAELIRIVEVWIDCVGQGERPTQPYMVKATGFQDKTVRSALARLSVVLDAVRARFGDND